MQEKVICPTCHQVHSIPSYRSTCQYCNKIAAANDLSGTKGHVTICAACRIKRIKTKETLTQNK